MSPANTARCGFGTWQVYAVADGEQAVQFLKMRSVQLVMLDATP